MELNPAEYVIYKFGGVRATARAIGCYPSVVSRWRKPERKGLLDVSDILKLKEAAERMNIHIHPLVYYLGGKIDMRLKR